MNSRKFYLLPNPKMTDALDKEKLFANHPITKFSLILACGFIIGSLTMPLAEKEVPQYKVDMDFYSCVASTAEDIIAHQLPMVLETARQFCAASA